MIVGGVSLKSGSRFRPPDVVTSGGLKIPRSAEPLGEEMSVQQRRSMSWLLRPYARDDSHWRLTKTFLGFPLHLWQRRQARDSRSQRSSYPKSWNMERPATR